MKIVFLSYLHGFGGAEKQNIMLANAMADKGHDVSLITISVNNICYDLNSNVKLYYLPDRNNNLSRIITRYIDTKDLLIKIRPDLVVNFWFQSAYLCAFMNKEFTGKVIYAERGDPGDEEYKGLLGIVRKLSLPFIDAFVFQSKGACDYFKNKIKDKSIIIPNPSFVQRDIFPNVIYRRKAIITVGRLHPQKNHRLLIDSFSLIEKDFPDFTLEIYGDGELKTNLQAYINSKNLQNKIYLMGTDKNIYEKMLDASIFVLSSDYEGLPNTLIEAMSLGVPCISTDCRPGGAKEIITQEVDGIIVPCNDKNALSYAMRYYLKNTSKANFYGRNAEINMKRFNPEVIYDKWEKFFLDVIKW